MCPSVRLELCYISRPLGSIYIYMSGEAEKEEGRDQSAVKVPPERRRADLSSTFFFPFYFSFFCVCDASLLIDAESCWIYRVLCIVKWRITYPKK